MPQTSPDHDDELRSSYDLAMWLINFEFQDPRNRHMSYRELARIYATKIEAYTAATVRAELEKLVAKIEASKVTAQDHNTGEIYVTNDFINDGINISINLIQKSLATWTEKEG